jgi:hypothetical protein
LEVDEQEMLFYSVSESFRRSRNGSAS